MMHSRQPSPESTYTPGFEMHEQRDERGAVRLSLSGELDLAVADRLRSRLQKLARAHATVILDLSDLQFIDSTGIHVLITHFNHASRDGWELRIDPNLTSQVRRVIELVGVNHILWQRPGPAQHHSSLRIRDRRFGPALVSAGTPDS